MTTQLEVLNHVIGVVGETAVSSVTSNHPTAQAALKTVKRVSKQFQLRGWWFNKEYQLTLTPNLSDNIIVPQTTIKLTPSNKRDLYVWRGDKLYDPINHTYTITADVQVDCTLELPIEEIPESAAMYIMHKAAYDFYIADDGDESKAKFLLKEVNDAWAAVYAEQLQMSKVNAKQRPVTAYLRAGLHQHGGGYNPMYPGGGN